jgi:hypothetical protein
VCNQTVVGCLELSCITPDAAKHTLILLCCMRMRILPISRYADAVERTYAKCSKQIHILLSAKMTYSRKMTPIYSTSSAVERLALRFRRCMGSHSKHLGALYLFASKNRAFYALARSLPAASHRRCRGPFFLQVSGQNLGVSTQTFHCQRL